MAGSSFPLKALLPAALTTMLAIFAMGLIVPIIPFYVVSMGGEEADTPYIFSTFSLAALISAPLWGALSDRYGRRRVMMLSLIGTVLSYGLLTIADDLIMLYGARIVAGLSAGWMATLQAYVADVTTREQRAKGMGLMGAAFGIGFTAGPGLGAMLFIGKDHAQLTGNDFILPSLIALGLSLAALLLGAFSLKEPERQRQDEVLQQELNRYGILARWFSPVVFKTPSVTPLLLLYFCVFIVFTAVEGVFAMWAFITLDFGPMEVGYILAFGGFITIGIQGGLIGYLTGKLGEQRVVLCALIALMLALVGLYHTQSLAMLLLSMLLLALAMGLHNPAMQSLISLSAPDLHRGRVLGTAQSAMSLSRVLGPAWGAVIFGLFSVKTPFLIGFCFLVPVTLIAFFSVLRQPVERDK